MKLLESRSLCFSRAPSALTLLRADVFRCPTGAFVAFDCELAFQRAVMQFD